MTPEKRQRIKEAFMEGRLQAKTADPETGEVSFQVISDVMKHASSEKKCIEISLENGSSSIFTEDHSLFKRDSEGFLIPTMSGDFEKGDKVVCVYEDKVEMLEVVGVEEVEAREFMYDLCVPGPENFTLTNGILAHNSYSIGGISLDIERSSKYEGLKGNAESQLDKAVEMKARTTKIIRGLMQPKYGRGIRSSFGPHVGRGVLSPRSFLVLPLLIGISNLLNTFGGFFF